MESNTKERKTLLCKNESWNKDKDKDKGETKSSSSAFSSVPVLRPCSTSLFYVPVVCQKERKVANGTSESRTGFTIHTTSQGHGAATKKKKVSRLKRPSPLCLRATLPKRVNPPASVVNRVSGGRSVCLPLPSVSLSVSVSLCSQYYPDYSRSSTKHTGYVFTSLFFFSPIMAPWVQSAVMALGMAALATAKPATAPGAVGGNAGTGVGTGAVGGGAVGGTNTVGAIGTGTLLTSATVRATALATTATRPLVSVTPTGTLLRTTGALAGNRPTGTANNNNQPTQSSVPGRGTQNNGNRNASDKTYSASLLGLCVAAGAAVFGTMALA
ncbi:hypothetical protein L249_7600 [Ophiocordyceps polyrhachis-furcata BCC 54312]|uniref:Uncharacterized protein n=1 Tax=Ophiocordyceps polyrhachis-furcata BCC 54312 TaxID=1330021 RepID=A0A367LA93_9HYPO|nr:hypothetical protein L249_7600 [Ophiocordyceps polyrhachis-furcata BCC 54312]